MKLKAFCRKHAFLVPIILPGRRPGSDTFTNVMGGHRMHLSKKKWQKSHFARQNTKKIHFRRFIFVTSRHFSASDQPPAKTFSGQRDSFHSRYRWTEHQIENQLIPDFFCNVGRGISLGANVWNPIRSKTWEWYICQRPRPTRIVSLEPHANMCVHMRCFPPV